MMMTLEQLLPELAGLSRDEKWRVVESLTQELTSEPDSLSIRPGGDYEVWSPIGADDAAATLLGLHNRSDAADAQP